MVWTYVRNFFLCLSFKFWGFYELLKLVQKNSRCRGGGYSLNGWTDVWIGRGKMSWFKFERSGWLTGIKVVANWTYFLHWIKLNWRLLIPFKCGGIRHYEPILLFVGAIIGGNSNYHFGWIDKSRPRNIPLWGKSPSWHLLSTVSKLKLVIISKHRTAVYANTTDEYCGKNFSNWECCVWLTNRWLPSNHLFLLLPQ